MRAFEKLGSLIDGSQQFPRVANIQRKGDWDQGDAVPQVARAIAAAQIDRNHYADRPPFNPIAVQFEITSDSRRHESENDIVHAGSARLSYGLDVCQRDPGPGKFLGSAVQDVEPEPLCG